MLFLESLRDPVIPFAYYHKCLEASNNFTLCKQVLKKIPRSHRNVFKYLAAFIRELLLHNDDNKMDPKTLATHFGELFLRAPPAEREKETQMATSTRRTVGQQRSRKKASFMYQFILNEYDD
ncbi:putative inositol polyphosphate 5-phosphatase OCRL-1 [Apostichopus japonicus]|uniref:Putative inositol polyphosphate 5-phosphatase OCRL-1 n=2 Tax=Stichopus japonicus TaxID=307972 RepID=A0A2G8JJX5_STIJA|nr:putative inositol polyphosphate 5-phosphatase OCRL-1 [Apostichopus japonicus]